MTTIEALRTAEEACKAFAYLRSVEYRATNAELNAAAAGLAKMREELPGVIAILRRGIGAIEACAMEKRGVAVAWTAVDATQDEMRAILARLDPQPETKPSEEGQ